MAPNQILNQNQDMASWPFINDSQADQQHQQLDHVPALPNPNNQAPTISVPDFSSSSTDLLSMEFSQLSLELNNERTKVEEYVQLQYIQTTNAIMAQQSNQDILIQNYVSRLLGSIHQKEQELLEKNQKNFELQNRVVDLDSKLRAMQKKIALEKQAALTTNESDAASFCGDNYSSNDIINRYCSMCHGEISSIIIIPCKHLCCCKECEGYVYSCPVCEIVKEDCIEVSWPLKKIEGTNH